MDCFADDREALNDFAKYFNNSHLSDVTLIVGEETYGLLSLISIGAKFKLTHTFLQISRSSYHSNEKQRSLRTYAQPEMERRQKRSVKE